MTKLVAIYSLGFLILNLFYQPVFARRRGAVVTNGQECAQIGVEILAEGGGAADAAVAASFCETLACPQLIGLGGGFLATIYIKENNSATFLNARETAPAGVTPEMFKNQPTKSVRGGLAVGVPGMLKGLWELHQRYGKLEWRKVIEPSIELCEAGNEVTAWHADNFKSYEKRIRNNPSLREVYINPQTNDTYTVGEKIQRNKLCKLYRMIASQGASVLYNQNSKILDKFVRDVQQLGGALTKADMVGYQVEWKAIQPKSLFDDHKLFTAPLPGSGPLLEFFLQILEKKLRGGHNEDTPELWHNVIEAFKFGFAERAKLGDPNFNPNMTRTIRRLNSDQFIREVISKIKDSKTSNDPTYYGARLAQSFDHGTAHLSVLSSNGDAVALTGSLNYYFGAGIRSTNTGIILNNQMADFTYPGQTMNGLQVSRANMVAPGKRPLSSMTPFVVTDLDGNVYMVAGSAGGAKITEALTNVLVQKFYLKKGLTDSVNAGRIYHELCPMEVEYEEDFDSEIIDSLEAYGHAVKEIKAATAVTAILNATANVYGNYDPRRGGSVKYLD